MQKLVAYDMYVPAGYAITWGSNGVMWVSAYGISYLHVPYSIIYIEI